MTTLYISLSEDYWLSRKNHFKTASNATAVSLCASLHDGLEQKA